MNNTHLFSVLFCGQYKIKRWFFDKRTPKIKMNEEPVATESPENKNVSAIKHLVISGGGVVGFSIYAALRESYLAGFWRHEHLETIYATSVGSILAVILCLQYDWKVIDDYLLLRPWNTVFQINPNCILSAFHNRGLFDKTQIDQIFTPLFGGKDVAMNITLREFYEWSRIELHFFATEINDGLSTDVDFSHVTHPDWPLLDAVYCSCCIPGIFQPFIKDNNCFVDGGVFLNYPIKPCLTRVGYKNGHHVMGFKREVSQQFIHRKVGTDTTLLDTVTIFINKMMERALAEETPHPDVKEVSIDSFPLSFAELISVANSEKERQRLCDLGIQSWKKYVADNMEIKATAPLE